jgi:hypothetical protein
MTHDSKKVRASIIYIQISLENCNMRKQSSVVPFYKFFANYLVGLVKRVTIRIRHDPEMQDPDKSFRIHNTASCTVIRYGAPLWC